MANQNTAPTAEAIHTPELGDLVEGLDFRKVVDWAKDQDIPGYEQLHNMVGSTPITIDGKPATVGWIKADPNNKDAPTPPIKVENPDGEDIIIVEGGFTANITDKYDQFKRIHAGTRGPNDLRPGFIQFNGEDSIRLEHPMGHNDNTCWYVCFYPEIELPITGSPGSSS